MKLTPLDIRHKDFRRGMRGYADVEVDEFLDEVADEYERLFKENIDLNERLESLQEKIAGYKRIEETLQKTLVSAQASAEELKQNATKEAQLILRDAELKARQMVNDTYTEKQAIEQTMAKLRAAEQDFAFKFRQMLEGYLKQLDEAPERGASESGEQAAEFDRQAQAIKDTIARESAVAQAAPESKAAVAGGDGNGSGTEASAEPADDDRQPTEVVATADDEVVGAEGEEVDEDAGRAAPDDELLADVDGGVNENEFKW